MARLRSARFTAKDIERGVALEARARKRVVDLTPTVSAGGGAGDMLKATYDTDNDGFVDKFKAEYYGTTALPAASGTTRGRLIETKAAGQPGQLNYCITNTSGGYEWIIIGQSAT
jgi:hypothetical protein